MNQSVDAARQTDENTEIGDRLDLSADLVAAVVILCELLPRIGLALLDAQADSAALLVDVEHHHFNFLADVHHLGRIDVLVGPIHFRHVHQAFHALLDFDEATIVGNVGDLAEQTRVGWIAARDVLPRIGAELLQSERNALAFAVEFQNTYVNFFTDFHDLGGVLDALPSHVGDVQQAVDAAQIDECAIISEILDHAFDRCAFLQIVEQRGPFGAVLLLHHGAPRDDHIVALLVELDDLEFKRLVLEIRRIADRPDVDQRSRQERPDVVDLDGEIRP